METNFKNQRLVRNHLGFHARKVKGMFSQLSITL
jgi:hypothetical protein